MFRWRNTSSDKKRWPPLPAQLNLAAFGWNEANPKQMICLKTVLIGFRSNTFKKMFFSWRLIQCALSFSLVNFKSHGKIFEKNASIGLQPLWIWFCKYKPDIYLKNNNNLYFCNIKNIRFFWWDWHFMVFWIWKFIKIVLDRISLVKCRHHLLHCVDGREVGTSAANCVWSTVRMLQLGHNRRRKALGLLL